MIYDLEGKRPALIVIDVQREYFDSDGPAFVDDAAAILPKVNELIGGFRDAGQMIIFVRHANRADGSDVGRMYDFAEEDEEDSFIEGTPRVEFEPGLAIDASDIVVSKRLYSSFAGTELANVLNTARITSVAICGLMTSFCCESTARDAFSLDFETLFVADAVAGPDLEDADGNPVPSSSVLNSTCVALGNGFAEVVTVAELLDRL